MDAVTRICIARGYSEHTWLRLLEEARQRSTRSNDSSSSDGVDIAAIDTLLPTILASDTASGHPVTSAGQADSLLLFLRACLQRSEQAKKHALLTLLDLVGRSDAKGMPSRRLDALSMTLLESSPLLDSRSFTVQHIHTILHLLARASADRLPALFILTLTVLSLPLQREALNKSLSTSLHAARTQLLVSPTAAGSNGSPISPEQVQLALKCLDDLEGQIDPVASRKRKRGYGDQPASQVIASAELPTLCQHLLLSVEPKEVRRVVEGSLRARLAYERAHDLHGGPAAWAKDLVLACQAQVDANAPGSRTQTRTKSLVYGLLPGLLKELGVDVASLAKDQPEPARKWLAEPQKEMSERGYFAPGQISPTDLVSALQDLVAEYAHHASASRTLLTHVEHYVASSDLPSLASLMASLVSSVEVLDYVLFHVSFSSLTAPVQRILDSWDSSEDYGSGQSMELFGSLQLSLWAMARRYSRAYSVPSEVHALESLSAEHRVLVSSWITALYGNEGIDDELLRSTHPRVMLGLACTVVHQSLQAMKAGVIDKETLNGGLSYFTQDLLSFTIPGLVRYLRNANADEEIVKALLTDSVPATVLELAQASEPAKDAKPATTPTSLAGPSNLLQSVQASLASGSTPPIAIVDRLLCSPDWLLSSLLLTLPISGRAPLLEDALSDYLPRLFRAQQPQAHGPMSSLTEQMENIADALACALHRSGGKKVVEKAYAEAAAKASVQEPSLQSLFWERVRAF